MVTRGVRVLFAGTVAVLACVSCAAVLGLDEPQFEPGVDAANDVIIGRDAPAVACALGKGDCNGDPGDGCEADLQSSATNCGTCGRDCLGAACGGGKCSVQVLARGQGAVREIALDANRVYFTSSDMGLLATVDKSGGTPTVLIAKNTLPEPTAGLALDDTYVYVSAYAGDTGGAGARRVPKAGGSADNIDGCNTAWSLALDDANVFWLTGACGGLPRIRRSTKGLDAGFAESPVDNGSYARAFYGWMALDATSVYWANGQQIKATDKQALASVRLLTDAGADAGAFRGLAVADRVYAALGDDPIALDKGGGGPTVLANDLGAGSARVGIAVDGQYVYYVRPVPGGIARVLRTGGTSESLADGQFTPAGIATDGMFVYWANSGDGTLNRVAK